MAAFPPPPSSAYDWSNIGFQVHEVNGHIESTFSKATNEWSPLRFVADPYLRMHGMSPGLNYGQQAYEGLKAFRQPGDKGIAVFRPDKNARRMQHSSDVLACPRMPEGMFVQAVKAAVALNAEHVPPHDTGAALYIRPLVFGSAAQLGLAPPQEFRFCVFVTPTGVYHGTHPVEAFVLDEFDRAAAKGTGHAKVGGNYAPVFRWSDKARSEGFGITLHLDSVKHEEIDEFSTSAFIGVIDNGGDDVTLVIPDSQCAVDSVTSDSAQQLAKSFGWKVDKRVVYYKELTKFSEVFAAGTAAALVPVRSVTRRQSHQLEDGPNVKREGDVEKVTFMPDSQDEAGRVCSRILTTLRAVQLGKVDDTLGMRFEVTEKDLKAATRDAGGRDTSNGKLTIDQLD